MLHFKFNLADVMRFPFFFFFCPSSECFIDLSVVWEWSIYPSLGRNMNVVSDVYWLNNREACVRSAEEATLEAASQTHPGV